MRLTITSHTIVKNGMPFIVPVLKSASLLMSEMFVTISKKSTDGTEEAIKALNNPKIKIFYENVPDQGMLTAERQKLADMTETDWILFLDDDDYWNPYDLDSVMHELDDSPGLAVNPYQVIDKENHDGSWWNKWFTKFYRNDGITYRHPWPKDMIYTNGVPLYWKHNPKVRKIAPRFYHLALVKPHSFRKDDLQGYTYGVGKPALLDKPIPEEIRSLL